MNIRWWHLGLAITLSLSLHAGADFLLQPRLPTVQQAGISEVQIAIVGSDLNDMILAGAEPETVVAQPMPSPMVSDRPVPKLRSRETNAASARSAIRATKSGIAIPSRQTEAPMIRTAAVDLAKPASALAASRTPAQSAEVSAKVQIVSALKNPAQSRQIESLEATPVDALQRENNIDAALSNEASSPVEIPAATPVPVARPRPQQPKQVTSQGPRIETPEPKEPEVAKSVEKSSTRKPLKKVAALVRPVDLAKKPAKRKKKAKKRGNKGASKKSAKKGSADGKNKGSAKSAGRGGKKVGKSGNARVSNYPGKVRRKLRRSVRYPRKARSAKTRGTTTVRFRVSRDGRVSSAQVVRGSGSALLDTAAMAAVRRAAPFPKIPSAANRSSWTFTVPVQFAP